jgi:two-component system NtrC family sensor kinase
VSGRSPRRPLGVRLWVRLTLVVAVLSVVPLVVVGAAAVQSARETARVRPEESLARHASTAATSVGAWLDAVGRSLVGWQGAWDLSGKDDAYVIGLLRAVWLAHDAVVTVTAVNSAGEALVPAQFLGPADAPTGREPGSVARADAMLDRLPGAVAVGERALGAPYRPTGSSAAVVPLRVGGDPGIAAEIGLGAVADVFGDRGGTWLALVDEGGTLVLGALPPEMSREQLEELAQLRSELTFSPTAGRRGLRGAVAPVPGTTWSVVAVEPAELALSAVADIRRTTVLVGLAVVALIIALAVAMERLITRPVEALRHAAGAVADGDYGMRVHLERSDELGELGAAFNDMAARLGASRAEVDALNRGLQDRVDERTRELQDAQAGLVRAGQLAAVGELGAGLAHELNNPLSAILGTLQLLQARGNPDREALARVEAAALRCRELVATMLRFSAGELSPAQAPTVDLAQVAHEAAQRAKAAFAQRGVVLVLEAPEPVEARVEPAVAEQVIARFLAVFRAGLPEGTRLSVAMRRVGGTPTLTFDTDQDIASEAVRDDWRAAGMQLWYARRMLDAVGATVIEPTAPSRRWIIRWPPP